MADTTGAEGGLPTMAFVGFQATFAILTVALISGAIADRARFRSWMVFVGVWATVVYFPVAHWVFAFDGNNVVGGWIANTLGAIDFAGGTAAHINAGSALAADNTAAVAWVNTLVATGAATLGWLGVERVRDGHSTSLGAASGIVAGLVAITPACSAVSPLGAIAVGGLAGVGCALAVGLKYRFGYDDSLDVVGVHLVGGLVGTILIGFLGTAEAPAGADGLLYGGGLDLLGRQVVGAAAVLAFSFLLTLVIGLAIQATIGFRVDEEDEITGIDQVVHAESAYDLVPLGSSAAVPAAVSGTSTEGPSTEGAARSTEGVGA